MSESKKKFPKWVIANNGVDIHRSDETFDPVATAMSKAYANEIVSLLSELEQLRGENEKLKADLKIMQELDAEHDKEWSASILKDAKITDLCNENTKYWHALESIVEYVDTNTYPSVTAIRNTAKQVLSGVNK